MNAKSAAPNFWKERDPWPYAHAIVPLTLYAMSRQYLFSLLLIYVWESVEALIGLLAPYYDENKYNSLISDPIVGALAITTLFLLDCATGWGDAFCEAVSLGLRVLVFVVVGLGSTVLLIDRHADRDGKRLNEGVVWLALGTALFGGIVLSLGLRGQTSDASILAAQAIAVWVVIVLFLAIFIAPRPSAAAPLTSTFWRIILAEGILFLAAIVILVGVAASNKQATRNLVLQMTRQEPLELIDSNVTLSGALD